MRLTEAEPEAEPAPGRTQSTPMHCEDSEKGLMCQPERKAVYMKDKSFLEISRFVLELEATGERLVPSDPDTEAGAQQWVVKKVLAIKHLAMSKQRATNLKYSSE